MLPVTFSPPGDEYEPSPEDRLRDAVWLMLRADDLLRKTYSYDDSDPSKGVRIYADVEGREDDGDKRIIVPQIFVVVALPTLRFQYRTNSQAQKRVTLAIHLLEPPDAAAPDPDVDAPPVTVMSRMERARTTLLRGTLYDAARSSEAGRVVDPYLTPLLDSGRYDPAELQFIATKPPEITYGASRPVPRKDWTKIKPNEWITDPVRDLAVSYPLMATYEIELANRE